jgi:hypothetical protein
MTTTDDQINAAIGLLRARGYSVTLPQADEWVTPVDLWRSHGGGCSLAQFRDRLHHSRCPHFQRHVGASGRMTTLRPTPALLAFLIQPSQPGKRLK